MRKRTALGGGDVSSSVEKAFSLLRVGRDELRRFSYRDPTSAERVRLRQVADKAWKALAAGADAYLCAVHGKPASGNKATLGVYKALGSKAAGRANSVFQTMHVDCGYQDERVACRRSTIETHYGLAAEALQDLKRTLAAKKRRGQARKRCARITRT